MKRILLFLLAAGLVVSCKKDNQLTEDATAAIPEVPATFGQNVLIEQFTSTFNGRCPVTDFQLDSLMALAPDRIVGVNIHVNDSLSAPQVTNATTGANLINDLYNPLGFIPAGMVNRNITSPLTDLFSSDIPIKAGVAIGYNPRCGLAIDATDAGGGYLTLSVHVGFSADMPGSYRLHVYLVENAFSSLDSIYDQFNDFSQFGGPTPDPNSTLYDLPYEINGYVHNHVLRKIISTGGLNGEAINSNLAVAGNDIVSSYNVNLSGYSVANCSIVAFVDKYGSTGTSHRVENVRSVKIGQVASWN